MGCCKTYLGFLLQVKGIDLFQLSFLGWSQQLRWDIHEHGVESWWAAYELEEEGGLVSLKSSLRVYGCGQAVNVILGSERRGRRELFDQLDGNASVGKAPRDGTAHARGHKISGVPGEQGPRQGGGLVKQAEARPYLLLQRATWAWPMAQ